MATIRLRDATELADYGRPYVVAEINTSHFGSADTAKQMILRAKEAGCDCVKFQSWSAETLYSKTFYDQNPIAKRLVKKFSFGETELMDLAQFSRDNGISFSSTPYAPSEAEFLLNRCQAPFVKVASMELTNLPYLDFLGRSGAAIVLSTGMGEMHEIRKAVATIEATGNRNLCILHCISIYPPEMATINLKNILGLRAAFPDYPIGFSDHSLGTEMAAAAVALGACLIEKHFTLDKTRIGMDNQMAIEPNEMATLVDQCRNVQIALGSNERTVLPAELEQRTKMRRSVIAARNIEAGTVIAAADLEVKRPGTGIPPERMASLIGRTALRAIEADTLIQDADLSA
jgi:N-acetylneuraminate synthase